MASAHVVRWPLSLVLIVFAAGLLFEQASRRKQPALSWLLFGAVVAAHVYAPLVRPPGLSAALTVASGSLGISRPQTSDVIRM